MSENFVTRSLNKDVCEGKKKFQPVMEDKGESTIKNRSYGGEFLMNGGTTLRTIKWQMKALAF
jgi:hypothetical protein